MAKLPKLLVLGLSLPGGRDGGGVVRDAILKRYPKDRYVCFGMQPHDSWNGDGEIPESIQNVPCLIGSLVPHLRIRGARILMPILRFIGYRLIAKWRVPKIVAFGKRHSVELVWAELYGDTVIIAQQVAHKLGVPFVGTVWDDPEGWIRDFRYDKLSKRLVREKFHEALVRARYLSTAGEAMQRAYEKEYGVHSVILRYGFNTPILSSKDQTGDGDIIIGFVGSVYGGDAWKAFFSAVAQLNKSGRFPQIRIRTFGGPKFPYQHDGVEIENRGWQPEELMLQQIAETDFCYLPYWFNPQKRRHVELSFPNKFETYLAAGRPVFYHGPEYAGIVDAIKKYGVGLCVHSLDAKEIGSALGKIIKDISLRELFSQSAISAFHSEFNGKVMMKNFAELIDIDPDILFSEKRDKFVE
jgi:glycosyltransferase involved in cell wall biosynthesis